jgi:hypothetical protein
LALLLNIFVLIMKLIKIVFFLSLLLSSFYVKANYGCNIGNYIYPNATGGHNNSGDPLYYNSDPITIRWWDQDPNCGIRDNKIYARTNGDDNCEVNGSNWGVVYYFNPADNNCIPLPIDDYVWVLVFLVGGVGALAIRKRVSSGFQVVS